MDDGKNPESASNLPFPQLTKFSAAKISAERISMTAFKQTESSIQETIKLIIEVATDSSKLGAGRDRHRIVATIEFDAKWRDKDTGIEIAIFSGIYRGLFLFNTIVETDLLKTLMSKKFYKDFLVAQVYPLAKNHMHSQLAVLGVNTDRRLGYDVDSAEFETFKPTPIKVPRRSRATKQVVAE